MDIISPSQSLGLRACWKDEDVSLTTLDFGVATPYTGQVRLIRRAFRKAGLHEIRVATTEKLARKRKAGDDRGSCARRQ